MVLVPVNYITLLIIVEHGDVFFVAVAGIAAGLRLGVALFRDGRGGRLVEQSSRSAKDAAIASAQSCARPGLSGVRSLEAAEVSRGSPSSLDTRVSACCVFTSRRRPVVQ